MKATKRKWTPEQKVAAVARLKTERPVDVFRDLNISSGMLHAWKKKHWQEANPMTKPKVAKVNGATHDAILYLRAAKRAIRANPKLMDEQAALLALLALNSLEGKS
jgi:transposase-like protein